MVFVLDQNTQHHSVKFYRACIDKNIRLEFLSVASCEFNSVEKCFAFLKSRLRQRLVALGLEAISEMTGSKWHEHIRVD